VSGARPPRVGLLTGQAWPQGASDDAALVCALGALGIGTLWVPWDAAPLHAGDVDLLLVRSCWDYVERCDAFLDALDRAKARGAAVWSPPEVVRWNADKRYLRDLAAAGAPIVPTLFCEDGDAGAIAREARDRGWGELVLKPSVSAGARHTVRARADEIEARLAALVEQDGPARGAWLAQPYLEEIEREGEWSLLYFDGAFSHAVRKRPMRGDFRVQERHGGTSHAALPPPLVRDAADAALAAACGAGHETPLYARVDGVVHAGQFALMELELIEPYLFFSHDPAAAPRLARAVARKLPAPRAGW
jgi:hypothetical protein